MPACFWPCSCPAHSNSAIPSLCGSMGELYKGLQRILPYSWSFSWTKECLGEQMVTFVEAADAVAWSSIISISSQTLIVLVRGGEGGEGGERGNVSLHEISLSSAACNGRFIHLFRKFVCSHILFPLPLNFRIVIRFAKTLSIHSYVHFRKNYGLKLIKKTIIWNRGHCK